ncbi:MAG: hypothetical protein EZS28_037221, partial [Streblomastix strix]
MFSSRGKLLSAYHELQKIAKSGIDDDEEEDYTIKRKSHKRKNNLRAQQKQRKKEYEQQKQQRLKEEEEKEKKDKELQIRQQEEQKERERIKETEDKIRQIEQEVRERLGMEDEDRISQQQRDKENKMKEVEDVIKWRKYPEDEQRERERDFKQEKDLKKLKHDEQIDNFREMMIYEDELAFWVRKPLPLMIRKQLQPTLSVIRREDSNLHSRRIQNCEKKLKGLRNKLDELMKTDDKHAKGGVSRKEKEKRHIEYEKADLKLTLYSMKAMPYRKFYDRDVEEKLGDKEQEDVYKQQPKTGQENQSKDED